MKPVLDREYKFENMINMRLFISGPNLEVPIEVPVEETSQSAPKVSRISAIGANLSTYGEVSTFSEQLM